VTLQNQQFVGEKKQHSKRWLGFGNLAKQKKGENGSPTTC
jgi:hypothetical protein